MNSKIEENMSKMKNANYIVKSFNKLIGIKLNRQKFDQKTNSGGINLLVSSIGADEFFEIDLGTTWLFIFTEIAEVFNKMEEMEAYSYQWILDKSKYRNISNYKLKLTYSMQLETVLTISDENDKSISIVFDRGSLFEFIGKIIDCIQNIDSFKFSFINMDNEDKKLAVAKIEEKSGTIITTYNGIEFGKPYLSESDKYQIKYSAIHRLLYGRWLSVHAERINISVNGVITTVDEEYVLDKNIKNRSTLAALVLLASLSFKDIADEQ